MREVFTKASIRNILAIITVIGSLILLYIFTVKEIPAGNKDVLLTLGGVLFGSGLTGIFGYFFGQSKTNEKTVEKTEA